MEEIYANIDYEKTVGPRPASNQTGPGSSDRRFLRAVVLCLGLFSVCLLAGLIGLGVTYHDSVGDSSAELSYLTDHLQASNDKLSLVSAERDQLNYSLAEMAKEVERLQSLSKQKKTCPAEWRMFCSTCYFFSTKSASWENARQDCRGKEADLVIIDSHEEQEFVSKIIKQETWMGLNDRDTEGIWKWTDGTPVTKTYWGKGQPDNGDGKPQWGEEDCAHFQAHGKAGENWNDRFCNVSMQWICEKLA